MRRSHRILLAALFAGTVILASGAPALAVDNGQIGIQPANEPDYFHVDLVPGAAAQEAAIISNHSSAAITLLTYPVDGRTTPQGGFGFSAQNDARTTVGAWAKLSATSVAVPANSQIRLPFQISVPANTPPGDYYGGIVIQAPPIPGKTVTVQGGTAVQLNIVQRQAARIYLTVAGTRHNKLQTGTLGWTQHGGRVDFSLPLHNTGNTVLHPTAELALSSALGTNGKLKFNTPESLLPGDSITLHVSAVGPGPIQVGAATANEHSEAGTTTATVGYTSVSWGIMVGGIAAIGLLIILAYHFMKFVRRARRAINASEGRVR